MREWAGVIGTLVFGLSALTLRAEEIELLSGQKINGDILRESADTIVIKCQEANGSMELSLQVSKIHAVTVKGQRRVLTEKLGAPEAPAAAPPAGKHIASSAPAPASGSTRTKAEVSALIDGEGTAPPAWWNSVQLNIPPGLDLTWRTPPPGSPWDARKWLGQYMWSTINANPARWKDGIRLLHHVLTVNQNDDAKLKQTMNALATAYAELLEDWPRAAYWWRKAGGGGHAGYSNEVGLARCYWKMGCKDMAVEALNADDNVSPDLIKAWGDIGETAKALQIAELNARFDPSGIYQAAGDVCRCAGQNAQSIAYYQNALGAVTGNNPKRIQRQKDRLQDAIDALKAAEVFNHLDRVPAGIYKSSSQGYAGPVEVTVEVKDGRLETVIVSQHHEKQYYSSISETPKRILLKQGIKGVDTTTGATITSEAIINAAAKSLAGK